MEKVPVLWIGLSRFSDHSFKCLLILQSEFIQPAADPSRRVDDLLIRRIANIDKADLIVLAVGAPGHILLAVLKPVCADDMRVL